MMKNSYILTNTFDLEFDKDYSVDEMITFLEDQVKILRSSLDDQKNDLKDDYHSMNSSLKDIEFSIVNLVDNLKNIESSSKYIESLKDSKLKINLSLTEFSIIELFYQFTDEDDILLEQTDLLRDYVCMIKRYLFDHKIVNIYEDFKYSDLDEE
jgi:hypothetical protein